MNSNESAAIIAAQIEGEAGAINGYEEVLAKGFLHMEQHDKIVKIIEEEKKHIHILDSILAELDDITAEEVTPN